MRRGSTVAPGTSWTPTERITPLAPAGAAPLRDHDCLRIRDQQLTDVGTLPRGTAGRGSRAGLWSEQGPAGQAPYENTSVRVGPAHRCTELHFPGRSRLSPAK